MRIAVSADNSNELDSVVSPHFGRCPYFVIVDLAAKRFDVFPNPGLEAHEGAGPRTAQALKQHGIDVVLTGQVGPNARRALDAAGIAMATALISALTNNAVRNDVAMTGEITLRGRVLPIGGLKEKALGAMRAGVRTIIIPEKNKKELVEIPRQLKRKIKFLPVKHMDEVLAHAILRTKPKSKSKRAKVKRK